MPFHMTLWYWKSIMQLARVIHFLMYPGNIDIENPLLGKLCNVGAVICMAWDTQSYLNVTRRDQYIFVTC